MPSFSSFAPRLGLICRWVWAAPCSLLGMLLGLMMLACGGQCRRVQHTLEFSRFTHGVPSDSRWARLPWQGITFGHVILGTCPSTLQALRSHERVHVGQYERWGLFFFLAYPISSLWALNQGRHPYFDNAFERAAYRLQDAPVPTETAQTS